MQIELRRMNGKLLTRLDWTLSSAVSATEMVGLMRARLMSHYDKDDKHFWPLERHRNHAPEEVRMLDDTGNVIGNYNLNDAIRDTGLTLIGIPRAH